jgi:hypothetical protein
MSSLDISEPELPPDSPGSSVSDIYSRVLHPIKLVINSSNTPVIKIMMTSIALSK